MTSDRLVDLAKKFEQSNFWRFMGLRVHSLEPERGVIRLSPAAELENLNHTLHGGVIASLLDSAMGLTIRSITDVPIATQTMTTQFVRAPQNGRTLYASGEIVKRGRRTISMQGRIVEEGEDNRLIAIALATFVYLNPAD